MIFLTRIRYTQTIILQTEKIGNYQHDRKVVLGTFKYEMLSFSLRTSLRIFHTI